MKNLIAVVMLMAVCASPPGVAAIRGEDARPALRVESSELVVGPVTSGSVAVATFVFHNDGEADVHILRAAPS